MGNIPRNISLHIILEAGIPIIRYSSSIDISDLFAGPGLDHHASRLKLNLPGGNLLPLRMKKIRELPAGAPGIYIVFGEKVFRQRSNSSKLNTLIRRGLFDKRSDRGTADKVLSDLGQSILCGFELGICFSGAQLGSVIRISRIPGIKNTSWTGPSRIEYDEKIYRSPFNSMFSNTYLPLSARTGGAPNTLLPRNSFYTRPFSVQGFDSYIL